MDRRLSTIDESVSGPLSVLPPLLPACYFSCRRAETALGLDAAPSPIWLHVLLNTACSLQMKPILRLSTFVVRAVYKGVAEAGDRNPTLVAREESSHLSHVS